MPELLLPMGLAALAALIVPILIHLVRRSERRLVDFAALRWLSERSRPREQIRLHERWLLALRLALVTSLALLLAIPVWRGIGAPGPAWIAVSPGVDAARARAAIPESSNAEWHWLAPGFPELDRPPSNDKASPIASLIRELDAKLPAKAALTLVVPQELSGLDAARLQLGHAVSWKVLPGRATATPVPAPAPPLKISVRHDEAGLAELPVVRALARSWEVGGLASALDIASAEVALPDDAQIVFWLAGAPSAALRQWIAAGGTAVVSRSAGPEGKVAISDTAPAGQPVLREEVQGRGRVLRFAAPLTVDALPNLRQSGFPDQLRALLVAPVKPGRAMAEAFAPDPSGPVQPAPAQPLTEWLALLAALLFVAERWLATGPRRVAE